MMGSEREYRMESGPMMELWRVLILKGGAEGGLCRNDSGKLRMAVARLKKTGRR